MTNTEYSELLNWAKDRGYELHPSIEYKIVDGIGGMYATKDIPKSTVLYTGPVSVFGDWGEKIVNNDYISRVFDEYLKGTDSEIQPMFIAHESLDSFKKSSIFFATEDELNTLKNLSPTHHTIATGTIDRLNSMVNWWVENKPQLSRDEIVWMILNLDSRSWSDGGFNPILDLFNHSNNVGSTRFKSEGGGKSKLISLVDYKAGDQIYDSYGIQDMSKFLASYNFFDRTDVHYVDLISRVEFPLSSDVDLKLYEEVKRRFNTTEIIVDGVKKYKILNGGAFLTEYGPTTEFLVLVDMFSRRDIETINNPKLTNQMNVAAVYFEWLNLFYNSIESDSVVRGELTDRLKPWYDMILKEKVVMENCIQWLKYTSTKANEIKLGESLESNK